MVANSERSRIAAADMLRLMAAADYIVLADPGEPGRLAVFDTDANGTPIGDPLAGGFRTRDDVDRWLRQRHNLPPSSDPQGGLWEPT